MRNPDFTPHPGTKTCAVLLGLALVTLAVSPVSSERHQPPPSIELDHLNFEPVITGLDRPVDITHAGDGSGRLFITQQVGRVEIFDGERLLDTPFLDLRSKVSSLGEQGLLSLAFHPQFKSNGLFFVDYSDALGDTVLSRFHVSGDPNAADPESETVLLHVNQPGGNHNGGQLQFGPDGLLYISLGDGGGPDNGHLEAQRLDSLLGKMLRIDVDAGEPFSIPVTNPFFGLEDARWEIWAYGLRNPWRFSFDRATGDLFIGDVGGQRREEVNLQPAGGLGGENYGWSPLEGSICFDPETDCEDPSYTLPIIEYSHRTEPCGGSVIGGYRYRGAWFPQLNGVYFYADHCTGNLYGAVEEESGWKVLGRRETNLYISTFGEDEAGELYFADHNTGTVYRITTDVPEPSLSVVSPSSAIAGSPDLTLTLAGSNFVPASEVRWNGSPRPTAFIDNTRLHVSISADDVGAQGIAKVSVFNPGPGGGRTEVIEFPIRAQPAMSPILNANGVVEAAGYNPDIGVAPGSITAVYGMDLADGEESAQVVPLPTTLAGAGLRFNGSLPAPQFFASPRQQNIQIPWELEGSAQATLTHAIGSLAARPVVVRLSKFSPGLFSLDASGAGQGAIVIAGTDSVIAAPAGALENARPVRPGELLAIFCTGLGPVNNTPATGMAASARPLSKTLTTPTVWIGGVDSLVLFSGLSPGSVGLYQVNAKVTSRVPAGNAIPVTLTIGGVRSNTVRIAVEKD